MQKGTLLTLATLFVTIAGEVRTGTKRNIFDVNSLEYKTDDNKNEKVIKHTNADSGTPIDELIEQTIGEDLKLHIDGNHHKHPGVVNDKSIDKSKPHGDNSKLRENFRVKEIKQYDASDKIIHDDDNDKLNFFANNSRGKRESRNSCVILDDTYRSKRRPEYLKAHLFGLQKPVHVLSTHRAPSRALAALLAAAIRYKCGYKDVSVKIDNRTVRQLAKEVEAHTAYQLPKDLRVMIHVDADWPSSEQYEQPALPNCTDNAFTCGMAGPRLSVMGRAPSVNVNVYAVLSNESFNNDNCAKANTWNFYSNYVVLKQCGFLTTPRSNNSNSSECLRILIIPDVPNVLDLDSSVPENVSICKELSNRTELFNIRQQKNVNSSFLFIDYDLEYDKSGNGRIRIVKIVPHLTEDTIALQLADNTFFRRFAPKIESILNTMRPKPSDLRQVLDKAVTSKFDYEEAACAWVNENNADFEKWTNITNASIWFLLVMCKEESEDKDVLGYMKELHSTLKDEVKEFDFKLVPYCQLSCKNKDIDYEIFKGLPQRNDFKRFGGLTTPGFLADKILPYMTDKNAQVVFYNGVDQKTETKLNYATSTISGGLRQLVLSIRHFLESQRWKRIAILSEESVLANSITAECKYSGITFKELKLDPTNNNSIVETLENFRQENVWIFFINTVAAAAESIICKAADLGMVTDTEYAWIAREWMPKKCDSNVQVFTVSYGWRGGNESIIDKFGGNVTVRQTLNRKWNKNWPIYAEQVTDALLFMLYRVQAMIKKHPNRLYDLRDPYSTSLIGEQLLDEEAKAGVVQNLRQKNYMRYNPLVYVTVWRRNVSRIVAVLRALSDTNKIEKLHQLYEPYDGVKRPVDDTSKCLTRWGDEFSPTCYDYIWPILAIIIVIIPIVWWRVRLAKRIKSLEKERKTLMRLLSRCERTASILGPYLVDRSALELYEELGSGHFGRVRFGMLRVRNPTPVAAKTLRDDAAPAEEAEFLREGSTMAALSYDHIVQLVGVCADAAGPPLLLMEHAFFGDLLKYLRQRRHLVEINERGSQVSADAILQKEENLRKLSDPEARHVSSIELTRLAREAALAVDHLAKHHILHRDIRAANCLVDARRVLKLADFGMARNVEVKQTSPEEPEESNDYKYICRRRGVFPVPWMAPESLERGEFSRASDVWALGVLMLEIATLGARPYGAWKPMQVLRFVQTGGRPPLPRDASYHTCEVTEMCWNEKPEDRASAKEVAEYLEEYKEALRGALRPAWPGPDVVPDGSDSGFSERDPEHEWSRGADLRVSTL